MTFLGDLELSHGLVTVAEGRVENGILERRTTPFFRAYSGPTTLRSTHRNGRERHSHARETDLATLDISAAQMRSSTTAAWPKPPAHLSNGGLGAEVSPRRQSPGGTAPFCQDRLARDSKS